MNTRFLPLLLITLMFLSPLWSFSQEIDLKTRDEMGLRGEVREYTEFNHRGSAMSKVIFLPDGRRSQQYIFDSDGSLLEKLSFHYNQSSSLIKISSRSFGVFTGNEKTWEFVRDEQDLLSQVTRNWNGKIKESWKYDYDALNRKRVKTHYEIDDLGQSHKIEEWKYQYGEKLACAEAYTRYRDDHQRVEIIELKEQRKYDERGLLVKYHVKNGVDSPITTTYTYSHDNKLTASVKKILAHDHAVAEQMEYSYNDTGHLIAKKSINNNHPEDHPNKVVETMIEYSFDDNGNWISLNEVRNGVPLTTTRSYLYF